jgi:phage regulator Rha-like protein
MENKQINGAPGIVPISNIQSMIFTIRGVQVMVDSDLAAVYDVETKTLNRAVKRNLDRFPESFRFQLTEDELENLRYQFGTSSSDETLRSQIATLENGRGKHRKYLPYVFTEQGVSMLSAVLRSETAVKVSIQIINAFVEMRRFLQHNANVFARLDSVERRQIAFESETEKNFEKLFQALETGEPPKQGIFFDGQVYDAYLFAAVLIRKAKKSLILIDNFVDDSVLTLLCKRKKGVTRGSCKKQERRFG